jgi:replicative DNA helicase
MARSPSTFRRFTRECPCPVCGGHPGLPRGHALRCVGFVGEDGSIHCTREERAGRVKATNAVVPTYVHVDGDDCRCGLPHASYGGRAPDSGLDPPPTRRIVSRWRWEVRSVDGTLQAVKHRIDFEGGDKEFRWQNPDGSWTLPPGTTTTPLYGAEVVAAADKNWAVVVTEGEKAADALRSLNFRGAVVVGTVTGAHAPVSPIALEPLQGRRVYLWADADEPGRAHMAQVASALAGIASDVYVIEYGECDKDDAADFVDRGGNRAALVQLVKTARPVEFHADAHPGGETDGPADTAPAAVVWKEAPIPLEDAFPRPTFPVETLPYWVGQWVREVSLSTQTPMDLCGMLSLSVLSAAASRSVVVQLTPDWREPVNLYVVVIAESGERKSRVFDLAYSPLHEWERRHVKLERAAHIEAVTRRKICEKRAEELRNQAAKDKSDKRAQLVEEAIAEETMASDIEIPRLPRLLADDITPEALVGLLAECGGRIALLSAEGGLFATLAGRYSRGVPNLDAVLKAHGGETIRVDRTGRSPEFVDRPALTLGLAVQPQVFRDAASNPDLRGRGVMARILYSWPASMVGRRATRAPHASPEVLNAYRVHVARFAETWAAERSEPRELRLTAASKAAFDDFRAEVEPQLAPAGDLHYLADWGSKLPGAVARIAALLHLAKDSENDEIPVETIQGAIDIGRYLIGHARAAFGLVGADPMVTAAQRVLRELAKVEGNVVTARDLMARLPRRQFAKVSIVLDALDLLEEYDWVQKLEEPSRHGLGRKPSPRYAKHPELLGDVSTESTETCNRPISVDSAEPSRENPPAQIDEVDVAIDGAVRATWLRIEDFWVPGLGVRDEVLVDQEEQLHRAAIAHDYSGVAVALAAYERRARQLCQTAAGSPP